MRLSKTKPARVSTVQDFFKRIGSPVPEGAKIVACFETKKIGEAIAGYHRHWYYALDKYVFVFKKDTGWEKLAGPGEDLLHEYILDEAIPLNLLPESEAVGKLPV